MTNANDFGALGKIHGRNHACHNGDQRYDEHPNNPLASICCYQLFRCISECDQDKSLCLVGPLRVLVLENVAQVTTQVHNTHKVKNGTSYLCSRSLTGGSRESQNRLTAGGLKGTQGGRKILRSKIRKRVHKKASNLDLLTGKGV